MNLDDLRVFRGEFTDDPLYGGEPVYELVTISDLKEVLSNLTPEQMDELGDVREAIETSPIDGHVPVSNPGRYLVVKL